MGHNATNFSHEVSRAMDECPARTTVPYSYSLALPIPNPNNVLPYYFFLLQKYSRLLACNALYSFSVRVC